jgi:hypothetical protein
VPVRRIAAFLCLLAIVGFRLEPRLMQLPFIDRRPVIDLLANYADGEWKQYPRFLQRIRAYTRPGDSIAIVAPAMKWDDGYSYAYYRGSYFLAGREVLPLVTADDRPHVENFYRARYIATWRGKVPPGRYKVICQAEGGALLQR